MNFSLSEVRFCTSKLFAILSYFCVNYLNTSLYGQQQVSMVWVETPLKNVHIESLVATNTALYACQRSAVYQSNNNAGTIWVGSGSGIDGSTRRGVYAGIGSTVYVYAEPTLTGRGPVGGGTFRSLDTGKTWNRLPRFGWYSDFLVKTNSSLFIYDNYSGVARSLDQGESWSTMASTTSLFRPNSILGVCAGSQQVFVCTTNAVF
jgi:hypothetical protein